MRLMYAARLLVLSFLLCSGAPLALAQTEAARRKGPQDGDLNARVALLEKEIQELRGEVAELRQQKSEAPGTIRAEAQGPAVSEALLPSENTAAPSQSGAAPRPERTGLLAGATPTGSLDIYYSYNGQQPVSGVSTLRLFDNQTNQFALNLLEFGLFKKPTDERRLGYNVTLAFGNAINIVNSRDPGGLGFAQYLKDGYASYIAPVGRGLQVDVGKFTTPAGPEVIDSYANWNYSRGLLFDYALPFYVFGARVQYSFNEQYKLTGYVVNGWDNVVDTYSSGKTVGLRLDWKPAPKVLVSETWLGGRAPTPTSLGRRDLTDTTIVYTPTNKLSLMANVDYNRGALLPPFQHPVHWFGVAAYGRYQFTRILASAVRYEHYDDPFGITTCSACVLLTPDHIDEITATGEMRFGHFITRLEYRYDRSSPPVFIQTNYLYPNQTTATLGLMYVIEPQDRFKAFATGPGSN
jgi:hypothetical protein